MMTVDVALVAVLDDGSGRTIGSRIGSAICIGIVVSASIIS